MKHELLAPAGSFDICKAVINAGADAVYLGGAKYGARAFAQNFTEDEVLQALDYAHRRGKKIFLTVNTLLKNRETGRELYDYLKPYYIHGLDAIIVQDYGVFQFVRKYFPDLHVHISTQMSVSSIYGTRFLQEMGAARIVTARELSLHEIRKIYDATGIEIESFIHGALCYCYSGQCLMSSMLGGRSGNRGRCAQPCRLAYEVCDKNGKVYHKKEKFPLSPKDLCALELLPELCEAGVYSFKIEGRMKSLEYAAGVTSVYREYLDRYENASDEYRVDPEDYAYLLSLGNRNGFTRGYYEMRNGRSMITLTDSSHSSLQAKEVFRGVHEQKIAVSARAVIREGEPMRLTLKCADHTVEVLGDIVQYAENRPLNEDDVKNRLSRTGDTPYEFFECSLDLGNSCFVPVKQLNALRRNGLEELDRKILSSYQRIMADEIIPEEMHDKNTGSLKKAQVQKEAFLDVFVTTSEQFGEVLKNPYVKRISIDLITESELDPNEKNTQAQLAKQIRVYREQIRSAGKKAAFCLPYVFRENSCGIYRSKEYLDVVRSFDHVWVRSYDSLGFAIYELGLERDRILLDHNLYVYSGQTHSAFCEAGLAKYTASLELNKKELGYMPNSDAQCILYGYTPMMISAQCVYKNYAECYHQHPDHTVLYLRDRYFKQFLITRNCKDCYNIIYNSQPLYLLHQADTVQKLGFESYRISFTSENAREVRKILSDYKEAFINGNRIEAPSEKDSFTNGHFNRGID